MFVEKLFQEQTLSNVEITPMVLLAAVDHYKRQCYPRVVGVLLGTIANSKVVVTNSFAVPFEENKEGYFLDTSYLQNMYELFYKVNSKEHIVGWYHTGPVMCANDKSITETMKIYCEDPVLAVINVHLETENLPVQAYKFDTDMQFVNLDVKIGADENEEVGVEHLLRDIKEGTGTTLKDKFNMIKNSLKQFEYCLTKIIDFIEKDKGKTKNVTEMIQKVASELPYCTENIDMTELYNCELVNCVISLNDLHENRKEFKQNSTKEKIN
ncbi:RPN8A [Ecytonucleospora hepatopenaei]|uniref:RPN8A n=1 Tax=Ecytonucleospora hepatopenaei TaxID=646526 RepID=A0A1W0E6H0_9MICR|nr:RPN8A [Ecytonucleospora hepatopenaei]